MINKIINEYIRVFNIKDAHILTQLMHLVDFNKVLDRIAEKKDVVTLHNQEGKIVNVFFYERN
jgi:hypothetical protein